MTNPFTTKADPAPAPAPAPAGQWLAGSASTPSPAATSSWGDIGDVGDFRQPEEIHGGSGNTFYPRFQDFLGRLVMIRPIKVERVPQKEEFIKAGSDGMTDRATVDMVILDGAPIPTRNKDGEEGPALEAPADLPGIWLFNGKLPEKCKAALRDGIPILLGRIVRGPQWPDIKSGKYAEGDWRAIEAEFTKFATDVAAAAAGGRALPDAPKFVWTLANHAPDEKEIAVAWLSEQARKATAVRSASIG